MFDASQSAFRVKQHQKTKTKMKKPEILDEDSVHVTPGTPQEGGKLGRLQGPSPDRGHQKTGERIRLKKQKKQQER